jgi:high-affinity Fe2+/Pb2+ permease
MNSKKYNNTKLAIGIGKAIISFVLLYLFIDLGFSLALQNYIQTFIENTYLVFIIFVFVIGIFS